MTHANRRSRAPRAGKKVHASPQARAHHHVDHAPGVYIITVSDTRTVEVDASGDRLTRLAEAAGHRLTGRKLVPDEAEQIRDAVLDAVATEATEIVIVTGGSGVAPRDVTPEAVEPLFSRALPGFGEAFRRLSFADVGAHALLSRAAAGLIGEVAVFLLPGSPAACELGMEELIVPLAPHLVGLLSG